MISRGFDRTTDPIGIGFWDINEVPATGRISHNSHHGKHHTHDFRSGDRVFKTIVCDIGAPIFDDSFACKGIGFCDICCRIGKCTAYDGSENCESGDFFEHKMSIGIYDMDKRDFKKDVQWMDVFDVNII